MLTASVNENEKDIEPVLLSIFWGFSSLAYSCFGSAQGIHNSLASPTMEKSYE